MHLEGATQEGTIAEKPNKPANVPARSLVLQPCKLQHRDSLQPARRRQNASIVPLVKKSSIKLPNKTLATDHTPKHHNRVKFAKVNVREYSVSLSQNPSCSEGPPIELGWDYREPPPVCLYQYEEERQPHRRRNLHDLILSDTIRRKMLLETYTQEEITDAIRQVETLKRQRVMTYMMLPASALDEAAEELYRYVTQWVSP